jgi:hypothetical protein
MVTKQEEGRHGRGEKWLIILARKLERPTLVKEENNKQVLKNKFENRAFRNTKKQSILIS